VRFGITLTKCRQHIQQKPSLFLGIEVRRMKTTGIMTNGEHAKIKMELRKVGFEIILGFKVEPILKEQKLFCRKKRSFL